MNKTIFFDLDGTLIDSMPIWKSVARLYIESKGLVYDAEVSKKLKAKPLSESSRIIGEHYNYCKNFDDVLEYTENLLLDYYTNEFTFKRTVEDKLKELKNKNFKMCITTANPKKYIEPLVKRLKLNDYIDFIFTPDILGVDKNDLDFFKKAIEISKASKDEGIYVFDDAVYALENVKTLGLIPVAVYDKSNEKDTKKLKEISKIYLKDFASLDVESLSSAEY